MRGEHHGKNAQELMCKPLNSFHVNKQCGIMPGLCKNVGWRFSERPPIKIARDHSKKKSNASSLTVIQPQASKHNPTKCRKSSHISHRPSTAYAANAQHGRRVMPTNTQHTDTVTELGKAAPKAILCGGE
ncbi:hypothetical protein TcCL_ESM08531 [Trypanosoma cruzi]|nr:hypothetical protein TcCL_ESM08531 [Trypanosoma cruzi]